MNAFDFINKFFIQLDSDIRDLFELPKIITVNKDVPIEKKKEYYGFWKSLYLVIIKKKRVEKE